MTFTATCKEAQALGEVESFLGFAGYYRHFITDFSKIAAPLNALTPGANIQAKKTAPISWSPECQQTFDHLKRDLFNAPVLAYADFSQTFTLYMDARFEGLGAVTMLAIASTQHSKTTRTIAPSSWSCWPFKWAVIKKFKDSMGYLCYRIYCL